MYYTIKALHLASLVVLLGSVALSMLWKRGADRTGDPVIMAHVMQSMVARDHWIRLAAAACLLLSGVAMASMAGLPIPRVAWLWQALLALASVLLIQVYPISVDQRYLRGLAQAANGDRACLQRERYDRRSWRWLAANSLALVLLCAALALMVFKPAA